MAKKTRWVAYFDLLGFGKYVKNHELNEIVNFYDIIRQNMRQIITGYKEKRGIKYSHFSDSFLMYSKTDSMTSFDLIDKAAKFFFTRLIEKKIPLRGAITVGEFYTHEHKNVFLGKALVDVVRYADCQDWVGFILTPMAESKISKNNYPLQNYIKCNIPLNSKRKNALSCFAFDMVKMDNGNNILFDKIVKMKDKAPKKYREKYKNSENFIHP